MSFATNYDLLSAIGLVMTLVLILRRLLDLPQRLPRWNRWLSYLWVPALVAFVVTAIFRYKNGYLDEIYLLLASAVLIATLLAMRDYRPSRTVLLAFVPAMVRRPIAAWLLFTNQQFVPPYGAVFKLWGNLNVFWFFGMLFLAYNQKRHIQQDEKLRAEEERARQLALEQNLELERLVAERAALLTQQADELQTALTELRATQAQLIQREKMASLGELTAGIAHEIQNPLNFVNNFADVSTELVTELEEEQSRPARDAGLEDELLADLKQNLLKINQHGQRASSIVKGMLAHSRTSTGERQLTDLNILADEYMRLAYHGLRAKDKTFNATLQPDLAAILPLVPAVSGDIGRVLLNLFTNALYAVQQRQQAGEPGYAPTVGVTTRRVGEAVEVRVRDNGNGIPDELQQKIFQPFFTTKPSGEGTGLGLSLSHDIVVEGHGGTLSVESETGKFTEFVMRLPF